MALGRRLGTGIATVAAVIVASAGAATAAASTGAIEGVILEGDAPVSATIRAFHVDGIFFAETVTDERGRFLLPDLEPGGYQVQVGIGEFEQWMHGRRSFVDADTIVVTAGETTSVTERLLPTGSLEGKIAGGFAGFHVLATAPDTPFPVGFAVTDPAGRFVMSRLHIGTYRIAFEVPGGAIQYYPGTLNRAAAGRVVVEAGRRTVISDDLLPYGAVSGRLVEKGLPVAGATVEWIDPYGGDQLTVTDADGRYRIGFVFANAYTVGFVLSDTRTQWAHGHLTPETADRFGVTAATETVLDEAVLPTGRLHVKAVDANTGKPIISFCAGIAWGIACTDDGVAELDEAAAIRQTLSVFADGYQIRQVEVDVPAGDVANVTVPLEPVPG